MATTSIELRDRSIPDIASALQTVFGQRITAHCIGIKDPRAIGEYARGERKPLNKRQVIMRDLAHVAEVLLVRDEGSLPTVREVMVCESPVLTDPDPNRTGGQAPAEVFHNGESYRVVAVANQL